MKKIVLISIVCCLFSSCKKDEDKVDDFVKSELNGLVQKGPFLNGSSVEIYELESDFKPTGKLYSTQILDNSGVFKINNVALKSKYVQLKGEGYYFNEVSGENSKSPIALYAFVDVENKNTVNVNVLSHLEKSRLEHLVSTGLSFKEAKQKARAEVLNVFKFDFSNTKDFEDLDISKNGEENAMLLAVSVITQGFRTEAELSDLLANINTDLREDGVLNSSSMGSKLINDARLVDLTKVRTNIEARYSDLGMTVEIPNFEKYVRQFVDNSNFQITNIIEYPNSGAKGFNLLYDSTVSLISKEYSIAAKLPKGTSLKVVVRKRTQDSNFTAAYNSDYSNSGFTLQNNYPQNFILTSKPGTQNVDLEVRLMQPSTIYIDIYENNAALPTYTRTITWN